MYISRSTIQFLYRIRSIGLPQVAVWFPPENQPVLTYVSWQALWYGKRVCLCVFSLVGALIITRTSHPIGYHSWCYSSLLSLDLLQKTSTTAALSPSVIHTHIISPSQFGLPLFLFHPHFLQCHPHQIPSSPHSL